jgi:hypothetical protein
MAIQYKLTNPQILKALKLFEWAFNKHNGETHLGANSISKVMGFNHGDREPGMQLLKALETANVLENTGLKPNPYAKGVPSFGHNPTEDKHAEMRPFRKRGKNWDFYFNNLKLMVE